MSFRTANAVEFNAWRSAKRRCTAPNSQGWKNYGGRGIRMCERWLDDTGFESFLEDMGKCPPGYSIDRINNDGNYEPSNCRWATRSVQVRNRRVVISEEKAQWVKLWAGLGFSAKAIAGSLGVSPHVVYHISIGNSWRDLAPGVLTLVDREIGK